MGGVTPEQIQSLATAAGVGAVRAVAPMAGGANNRVLRVQTDAGTYLLKSYFRHPDDPRDRLGTEFAFARFAWDNGVRCVPRPLACDPAAGLGLFEFVAGRPLARGEADAAAVDQALDFFRTLNRVRHLATDATPPQPLPEAGRGFTPPSLPGMGVGGLGSSALPRASESCFSLDDHFATVGRRVERLQGIPVGGVVDLAAAGFVDTALVPAWIRVLADATATAAALGLRTGVPLPAADRCLSPSDFGYHNAILAADGKLRFIDFEYAGWDDPSKLVCDFFCQPAVPAPPPAFDHFARSVAAEMPNPGLHVARSALLLPVYRVKWCCIMLNEFLPVGGSRRAFSGPAAEQESRKVSQLAKARAALAAVAAPLNPTRKVA